VNQKAIDASLQLMEAHINALNKQDSKAIAETLHFPHHRLSDTTWKTWETPEHYFEDFLKRAGNDWKCSAFKDIKVLDASPTKVHLDAQIHRYDSNDNLITSFRSLWVIIEVEGVWAAKVRSSFAKQ